MCVYMYLLYICEYTQAQEQVAFADKILINKTDLVEKKGRKKELGKIEARIKSINPTANLIRCKHSKVDPNELIGINAFNLERVVEMDPEFLNIEGEHEHDPSVSSTSCKFEGTLNIAKLMDFIGFLMRNFGATLYRYKGVLSVAGRDSKYVFQGVGMIFKGQHVSELKWAKDEPRECRFVFIGKNLDKKLLQDGFMACRCDEKTRFKEGDKVLAYYGDIPTSRSRPSAGGKWYPAKVLRVWDEGNPYRLELEKDGKNIWVTVDSDDFVRAPEGAASSSDEESSSTRAKKKQKVEKKKKKKSKKSKKSKK
jgi:hypothetical protein